jgi:hypothetical protein
VSPATWRPKMVRKRREEAMMTKLTKSGWELWARGFGHALMFWPWPGTRGWPWPGTRGWPWPGTRGWPWPGTRGRATSGMGSS